MKNARLNFKGCNEVAEARFELRSLLDLGTWRVGDEDFEGVLRIRSCLPGV